MIDREPRHRRGGAGRAAVLVAAVAAVGIIAGVIVSCGGAPGTGAPAGSLGGGPDRSPALTDLELVTIPPVAVATDTAARSFATPSAVPDGGIKASRIVIARLDIDLPIVEGDGIDAPMGKAAHYPGSAWPDAGSNIYIYAHAQEGMFLDLWQAQVDDTIRLDLVDGSSRTYVVTEVLPRVAWNAIRYVAPTAAERLTLQTSTSYYSTAPRFIVIALPAT